MPRNEQMHDGAEVFHHALNCIWWCDSCSEDLDSMDGFESSLYEMDVFNIHNLHLFCIKKYLF